MVCKLSLIMGILKREVKTMSEKETSFPNVSLGGKLPMEKGKGNSGPVRRGGSEDREKNFRNGKATRTE